MEGKTLDNLVIGVDTPQGEEICLAYDSQKESFILTYWLRGQNKNYMEQMIIKKEDNTVEKAMAGFFDEEGINPLSGAKPKKLLQKQQLYFALKNKLEEINEAYSNQQTEEASAK